MRQISSINELPIIDVCLGMVDSRCNIPQERSNTHFLPGGADEQLDSSDYQNVATATPEILLGNRNKSGAKCPRRNGNAKGTPGGLGGRRCTRTVFLLPLQQEATVIIIIS